MFIEYAVLLGETFQDVYGEVRQFLSNILDSPFFWLGVCIALLGVVFIYKFLWKP